MPPGNARGRKKSYSKIFWNPTDSGSHMSKLPIVSAKEFKKYYYFWGF